MIATTCLYYSMLCVYSLVVDDVNYALIFIRDVKIVLQICPVIERDLRFFSYHIWRDIVVKGCRHEMKATMPTTSWE